MSTMLTANERALLREAARLLDAGAHTIETLRSALKALVDGEDVNGPKTSRPWQVARQALEALAEAER